MTSWAISGSRLATVILKTENRGLLRYHKFLGAGARSSFVLSVGFITSKADIDKFVVFAETLLNKKSSTPQGLNDLTSLCFFSFLHSGPLAQ